MAVIKADHLAKSFVRGGKWRLRKQTGTVVEAVKDLTFEIESGDFVGFLGPNGAGKSTTIKMMTGILQPTDGSVTVAGLSPLTERVALAKQIGVVFGQRTQLWWDLPLIESFRILQAMYKVPLGLYQERLGMLIELLELDAFLTAPVRQLSLGQRMRGELAAALLHQPKVLFLDEPTIGLDVTAKASVRQFLRKLNSERGTTIILTTHDMADVEELCGRILVISGGEKVFDGSVEQLHGRVGMPSALTATFAAPPDLATFRGISDFSKRELQLSVLEGGTTVFAQYNRAVLSAVDALELLRQLGEISDFSMQEPRLESVIQSICLPSSAAANTSVYASSK